MKPTLQQEEILKKYLREILLYRETYEEVYDHVLNALELKSLNISFQNAINEILNDDFGGGKGLVEMEKKCYKSIVNETLSQQWRYFKLNFKFPGLISTVILFSILYFLISKITNTSFIVLFLVVVGMLIPGLLILLRHYQIGYFTLDTKKSIKDKIMEQIAGKCSSILTLIMLFLSNKKDFNVTTWIVDYTSVFTLAIIAFVLLVLSLVRLSYDEFKVYQTR